MSRMPTEEMSSGRHETGMRGARISVRHEERSKTASERQGPPEFHHQGRPDVAGEPSNAPTTDRHSNDRERRQVCASTPTATPAAATPNTSPAAATAAAITASTAAATAAYE